MLAMRDTPPASPFLSKGTFPTREGLPPCQSVAALGDRRASLVDSAVCGREHSFQEDFHWRFFVLAGNKAELCEEKMHGYRTFWVSNLVMDLVTDDPAEAQAAFARGAEWVRTGVLP